MIWDDVANWVSAPGLMPSNWDDNATIEEWFLDMGAGGQASARPAIQSISLTGWEIWREEQ